MKKTLVAAVLVVLPVVAAAEKPHAGAEAAVRTARITTMDRVTDDSRGVSFKGPRREDIAGLKVHPKESHPRPRGGVRVAPPRPIIESR